MSDIRTLEHLSSLVQRWRDNADMLAAGNKGEWSDPAVGHDEDCASRLCVGLISLSNSGHAFVPGPCTCGLDALLAALSALAGSSPAPAVDKRSTGLYNKFNVSRTDGKSEEPETPTIYKSTTVGATKTAIRLTPHGSAHITEQVGPNKHIEGRLREIFVPIGLLDVFMGAYRAAKSPLPVIPEARARILKAANKAYLEAFTSLPRDSGDYDAECSRRRTWAAASEALLIAKGRIDPDYLLVHQTLDQLLADLSAPLDDEKRSE